MAERRLTGKQKMFVAEYLVDLNATQAAIRAGYSPNGAFTAGWCNLQKPHIQAAIAAAQAPRLAKLEMDAEGVLLELARVARANVLDFIQVDDDGVPTVDLTRIDRDKAAAIAELTVDHFTRSRSADRRPLRRVKFRLHDKLAALDKLARHFGLLRERVSLENPDGSAVEPKHDARQVARAVIAILERATEGGENGAEDG